MNKEKLDSLLWEQVPLENFLIPGHYEIKQKNFDDISLDNINELYVFRDDDYNIGISCVEDLERTIKKNNTTTDIISKVDKDEILPGTILPDKKLEINLFNNYIVNFEQIYLDRYESREDKVNYNLSCYRVEGKDTSKEATVIKEWFLNGSRRGLCFCVNSNFEYKVEGSVSGIYGDIKFPIKQSLEDQQYSGNLVHIKYKDTAFDVHFVGDKYGPSWSTNLSITYFEKYGRIPNSDERKKIRDYLSFFTGKRLIYIGEGRFDEKGNKIGFAMENPWTNEFNIRKLCKSEATPPIRDSATFSQTYFQSIQEYIDSFSEMYDKLDFELFFSSYWYAKEIRKPMDLPILASALEYLKRKWYEEIELNPETTLMEKKDFSKRIKPIKEMVDKQFEGTEYATRMKNSITNLNRMSISEQLTHFFESIDMPIGRTEKEALHARNLSVHGAYKESNVDYQKLYMTSQVYESIIVRTVLKLLKYHGTYIDYGSIGYPAKDINCPSGSSDEN